MQYVSKCAMLILIIYSFVRNRNLPSIPGEIVCHTGVVWDYGHFLCHRVNDGFFYAKKGEKMGNEVMDGTQKWFCLLPETSAILLPMDGLGGSGFQMEDPAQYLQREEKIFSLLRKKKWKPRFTKNQTLERIQDTWDKTILNLSKSIGKQIQKDFISQAEKHGIQEACGWFMSKFVNLPGWTVGETANAQAEELVKSCAKNTVSLEGDGGKGLLIIRFHAEEYGEADFFIPVNATLTDRYHKAPWKLRNVEMDRIYMADFAKLASELYLRDYLVGFFRDLMSDCETLEEYLGKVEVGRSLKWWFGKGSYGKINFLDKEEWRHPDLLDPNMRAKSEEPFFRLIIDNQDPKGIGLRLDHNHINKTLTLLKTEYMRKKEEARRTRTLSGEYARSFQTKKNIPDKYLRAMANSGFNDYFGYVEFDADCDLSLVRELHWEYQALAKTVGIPAYMDTSLRFRKLGNHHATGLYYPMHACLCVDVRFPGSMAHEVGHMIDYHAGHISDSTGFLDVYDCYAYLLRELARTTDDLGLKAKLNGRSKYNLSYYLQSTEVFARCFEMYLVRIIKVDNSLCARRPGIVYPEDDELNELIESFFSTFMVGLRGESSNEKERRKVPKGAVLQPVSGSGR